MAVQARPEPDDDATPTVHELLVTVQQGHLTLEQAIAKLLRAHELAAMPADLRGPFRMGNTAGPAGGAKMTANDDVGVAYPSLGVLNSSPTNVYLGVGGVAPRPGQGAIVSPANSLLVLPLGVADLELGVDAADPTLASGDAVVHVLRFHTVQAAFLAVLS